MFDFFKTDTERRRDDYRELYERLEDRIRDHDRKIAEANDYINSFQRSMPNLAIDKVPSNHFAVKQEIIIDRLVRHIERESNKRQSLTAAKNKAYDKYLQYKKLAIKEAEKESK